MDFFLGFWAPIRGVIDDPAISTMIWIVAGLYAVATKRRTRYFSFGMGFSQAQEEAKLRRTQLLWGFAILGLILYPASLGLTVWDPYRDGYAPTWLLALTFVLAVIYWFARNTLGAVMLALATVAFVLEIKQSTNYWDYLVDPIIVVYCWSVLLARGFGRAYSGLFRASRGRGR